MAAAVNALVDGTAPTAAPGSTYRATLADRRRRRLSRTPGRGPDARPPAVLTLATFRGVKPVTYRPFWVGFPVIPAVVLVGRRTRSVNLAEPGTSRGQTLSGRTQNSPRTYSGQASRRPKTLLTPQTHDADEPRLPRRPKSRIVRRCRRASDRPASSCCCVILLLGCAVLWLTALSGVAPVHPPYHISWLVFIVMFAMSEIFAVYHHLRRETHTLSLNEIPLVLGLFFLGPLHLLLTHVTGSASRCSRYRRQRRPEAVLQPDDVGLGALVGYAVFRTSSATPPHCRRAPVGGGDRRQSGLIDVDVRRLLVTLAIYLYRGRSTPETLVLLSHRACCSRSRELGPLGLLVVEVDLARRPGGRAVHRIAGPERCRTAPTRRCRTATGPRNPAAFHPRRQRLACERRRHCGRVDEARELLLADRADIVFRGDAAFRAGRVTLRRRRSARVVAA